MGINSRKAKIEKFYSSQSLQSRELVIIFKTREQIKNVQLQDILNDFKNVTSHFFFVNIDDQLMDQIFQPVLTPHNARKREQISIFKIYSFRYLLY